MRDGWIRRVPDPFPSGLGEIMAAFSAPPYIVFGVIFYTFGSYGPDLVHGDGVSFKVALLACLCGVLAILSAVGAMFAGIKNIPSLWLPYVILLTLDVFIGIFSICSLFVRTPPCLGFMEHLNWRWPNNAVYMYAKVETANEFAPKVETADEFAPKVETADEFVPFSISCGHTTVMYFACQLLPKLLLKFNLVATTLYYAGLLLPKFYLVMCGWRGYKAMKFGRWEEKQVYDSTVKLPEKGLLPPSDEEAVALPAKEPPTPACSG